MCTLVVSGDRLLFTLPALPSPPSILGEGESSGRRANCWLMCCLLFRYTSHEKIQRLPGKQTTIRLPLSCSDNLCVKYGNVDGNSAHA